VPLSMSLLVPEVDLVSNWPSNIKWELVKTPLGNVWRKKGKETMECPSLDINKLNHNDHNIIPQFTDEEYSKYFQSDFWTLEETKKLWKLCNDYNMRFTIIANRMESKNIYEIKHRFFYILNKLHQIRGMENINFIYDKEYDLNRNRIIEQLSLNYSPELAQEEQFIKQYINYYSKDLNKRWKLREKIIMHFAGATQALTFTSTMPDLLGHVTEMGNNMNSSIIGIGGGGAIKGGDQINTGSFVQNVNSIHSSSDGRGGEGGGAFKNKQKHKTDSTASSHGSSSQHNNHNGPGRKRKPVMYEVKLQSQAMKPIKVGLCRRIDRMMLELGVPLRPQCPTKLVIAKYDKLRSRLIELDEQEKSSTTTFPHSLIKTSSSNNTLSSSQNSISSSSRQNVNEYSMMNSTASTIPSDGVNSPFALPITHHPSSSTANTEKKKRKR